MLTKSQVKSMLETVKATRSNIEFGNWIDQTQPGERDAEILRQCHATERALESLWLALDTPDVETTLDTTPCFVCEGGDPADGVVCNTCNDLYA